MNSSRWRVDRRILACLLLISFACVQTATALDFHHHDEGGPHSHCCPACHAGHMAVLQPDALEVTASTSTELHERAKDEHIAETFCDVSHASRAPPA